jgi:protein-S-isoprenylcysteine O-methyltransferase Ste14
MAMQKSMLRFYNTIVAYIVVLISISGFVPKHASWPRAFSMVAVVALSFYLNYFQAGNAALGVVYFLIGDLIYLGFIFLVLRENGFRHQFVKWWNSEEEGYRAFEAVLGVIFFLNGSSLTFISSSNPGTLFDFIGEIPIFIIVAFMIIVGLIVKIWAAKVVSIDIYYWKDMFLGKKICEFVVSGPYRFLSNPMYGIGQLPAYAFAIWYGSALGLAAAFLNQLLIFVFFFTAEKGFIRRIYMSGNDKQI